MKKILFVDDEPSYLRAMKRLIKRKMRGLRLLYAENIATALELIAENDFDAILIDIKMPGETGFDLLDHIKADSKLKMIPVVMVTGTMENDLKLTALDKGATDLLNKPFRQADLIARLNSCLRLKEYHDEIKSYNLQLEKKITAQTRQALLSAEISTLLVQKESLRNLLHHCVEAIVKHLDSAFARIWIFDEEKQRLELVASAGMYEHLNGDHQFIKIGQLKIGQIAQKKEPHLTNQVIGDPQINNQEWAKKEGMIAFAGHPLVVDDKLVGVLGMFSQKKLPKSVLKIFTSISDKIALGIERKKSENKAHFLTFYDSLTELPNREFFYEIIKKSIQYASRHKQKFALAFVDLDDFNKINKTLGHRIGDRCLKIVASRLSNVLRESDCVARGISEEGNIIRMGGDHFIILLNDISNILNISQVSNRILKELSKGCELEGHRVYLTASIGIAVYPDNGKNVDDLFKNSEAALDYVKKEGKNDFRFYSKPMNKTALELLDFEADLRSAVKQQDFILHYQPKIDLNKNQVVGMEALIRWQKSNGEIIPPNKFIPLAETNDLIIDIGNFVLKSACEQNKKWQDAGMDTLEVAVNISARQFGKETFVKNVLTHIESSGLDPGCLELEITETTIMQNPDKAIENLTELRKSGIKISLDDFGTGYSSLAYLQKLPLDVLKIDISFIKNVLTNPHDAAIVKTIIAMAHNLNLQVIAEGVEEKPQLTFLKKHGCNIIQGYVFSPPVSAEMFPHLLSTI